MKLHEITCGQDSVFSAKSAPFLHQAHRAVIRRLSDTADADH